MDPSSPWPLLVAKADWLLLLFRPCLSEQPQVWIQIKIECSQQLAGLLQATLQGCWNTRKPERAGSEARGV